MFKILLIIPSSTCQKITHYSYFILISLPIIPLLFFVVYYFKDWYTVEKRTLCIIILL